MSSIDRAIASITEDLRRDYLWDPRRAAISLRMHPNKFGTWWYATRGKLIDLFIAMPGETAAELACLLALAEQERQRRASPDIPISSSVTSPCLKPSPKPSMQRAG